MSIKNQRIDYELFEKAIQTNGKWEVHDVQLDEIERKVVVHIKPVVEIVFRCPVCHEKGMGVVSHENKQTGYYSFLGYKTFIEAPELQVNCKQHGLQIIQSPWNQKLRQF